MANKLFYTINGHDGAERNPAQYNGYIPYEVMSSYYDSAVFDEYNRAIWHGGMPYGSVYPGADRAEVFNDYERNESTAAYSSTMGTGTKSTHPGQTVVGLYNAYNGDVSGEYSYANSAFTIGVGTSDDDRHNALWVTAEGPTRGTTYLPHELYAYISYSYISLDNYYDQNNRVICAYELATGVLQKPEYKLPVCGIGATVTSDYADAVGLELQEGIHYGTTYIYVPYNVPLTITPYLAVDNIYNDNSGEYGNGLGYITTVSAINLSKYALIGTVGSNMSLQSTYNAVNYPVQNSYFNSNDTLVDINSAYVSLYRLSPNTTPIVLAPLENEVITTDGVSIADSCYIDINGIVANDQTQMYYPQLLQFGSYIPSDYSREYGKLTDNYNNNPENTIPVSTSLWLCPRYPVTWEITYLVANATGEYHEETITETHIYKDLMNGWFIDIPEKTIRLDFNVYENIGINVNQIVYKNNDDCLVMPFAGDDIYVSNWLIETINGLNYKKYRFIANVKDLYADGADVYDISNRDYNEVVEKEQYYSAGKLFVLPTSGSPIDFTASIDVDWNDLAGRFSRINEIN